MLDTGWSHNLAIVSSAAIDIEVPVYFRAHVDLELFGVSA